jgi:hypothetical protein
MTLRIHYSVTHAVRGSAMRTLAVRFADHPDLRDERRPRPDL